MTDEEAQKQAEQIVQDWFQRLELVRHAQENGIRMHPRTIWLEQHPPEVQEKLLPLMKQHDLLWMLTA